MSAIDDFLNKKSEAAVYWKDIISGMLNNEDAYGYAEDTLAGIYEYIEKNDSVSDKQIQAIKNIREQPSNQYE